MDEFFGGMDDRLRVSVTDSTMMSIVYHAMDKAHEKVKSKAGIVERLNEMSKFYELAVMQLEGCLKFVQQETGSCILESSCEEVLADLKEIRDRLQGRLEESELAISDKDRELTERVENEMKLRQALEMKERELVFLRANLEIERKKSEGIEEFVLGNRVDQDRDGEFSELKNSVDQQVWNIKQKLGPDYKVIDEERNRGIDNKKIEQMGLDIDMLKETLDLAFQKMQNAIFLSQIGPIGQQWRWTIEKDTISLLIRGLMRSYNESFDEKVREKEKQVLTGLTKHWSDVMNGIASLRRELEPLCSENDLKADNVKNPVTSAPSSISGWKISQEARERSSPEDGNCNITEKSSLKVEEVSSEEELIEREQQDDGIHDVAQMVKSHDSSFPRKSEEMNRLKQEIFQEQRCLTFRREKDSLKLKRRIQDIVVRLDNLMEWNAKLEKTFGDHISMHGDENFIEKRVSQIDQGLDTLVDVWDKIDDVSVSYSVSEDQQNEIRMLREEKEDANLQTMVIEETYVILIEGLAKEFYVELCDHDLECLIREGIYREFLAETVRQWDEKFGTNKIDAQTSEEIYSTVLSETLKDYGSSHDFALWNSQDIRAESNIVEDSTYGNELGRVEGAVREDICTAFLRQMLKEWNESTEVYDAERLTREEIYRVVFGESIRSGVYSASSALSQCQKVELPDNFLNGFPAATGECFRSAQNLESEEVSVLLFREMLKELKMQIDGYKLQSLIRDDIYQFVIVEAVKDASILFRKAESGIEDNILGDMLYANKSNNDDSEDREEENIIQKPDSLPRGFQVEEDMLSSESSELEEYSARTDFLEMKSEEREEHKIFEELPIDEEQTFSSVCSNLGKSLQHLVMSKALLSELGCSLGISTVGDVHTVYDQMTPILCVTHGGPSFHGLKYSEDRQLNASDSDSISSSLKGFLQVLADFELTVLDKLENGILRLEEVKYNSDPLVELVASLRNKELIYRKAFVRRCHNLQKAELEVDLLGDQVDVLLGLLERIYTTLHQYSPALQQYFEVSDILNLIKNELTGGAVPVHDE
ncbi:WPP domain-associated protein [Morella rubra]|uniref:WPP domain-associated protein n=1 Tax=Morella rubra TaxID=262757 RepID=A0A6A1W8G4_9ROSI|nr:WPP domain-associated protein [Morella rubra]